MSMNWAHAFAIQALSDLAARETLLRDPQLPHCHELHFLQMACEKLCKAYLMGRSDQDPLRLQSSHGYVKKTLPILAKQFLAENQSPVPAHIIKSIARLAERIELLAPTQKAGGTVPSNTEYPWQGTSEICVPCQHDFGMMLLNGRAGRTLIKCLRIAAARIAVKE